MKIRKAVRFTLLSAWETGFDLILSVSGGYTTSVVASLILEHWEISYTAFLHVTCEILIFATFQYGRILDSRFASKTILLKNDFTAAIRNSSDYLYDSTKEGSQVFSTHIRYNNCLTEHRKLQLWFIVLVIFCALCIPFALFLIVFRNIHKLIKFISIDAFNFIQENSLSIPVAAVTVVFSVYVAYIAYIVRCKQRAIYGTVEILFGIVNIVIPVELTSNRIFSEGIPALTGSEWRQLGIQFLAGLYIVVRGLVNIHDASGQKILSIIGMYNVLHANLKSSISFFSSYLSDIEDLDPVIIKMEEGSKTATDLDNNELSPLHSAQLLISHKKTERNEQS